MPLVLLHNVPLDWFLVPPSRVVQEYADRLRRVFLSKVPGITTLDMVTVSIASLAVNKEDTTHIIKVEGMFDTPDRTREVRQRLAEALVIEATTMFGQYCKIEVIIDMPFDKSTGIFVTSKP